MSKATQIANAIAANGIVRARNTPLVPTGSLLAPTDHATRLEPLCWDATYTHNGNEIVFTAVPVGTANADCVIVGNGTGVAAVGQLTDPGIIFSDYFSGCLFFLFRDGQGGVYGVHSYRSSGTYPDPTPYFDRLGAKLLYFFNTGNQFAQGNFGSVICHVKTNQIIVDFVETQGNGNIVRSVDHQVINNWQAHPGIPAPNVGGAMAPFNPDNQTFVLQSPKKSGLRHKVAKFLINYC